MLVQEKYVERLLAHNVRSDGREPMQGRQYTAKFLHSTGHLLFNIGKTQSLIKIKSQITAPRSQRPNEGIIHFKVDCQSCQNNFEQNRKLSNQITKLLQTVIVGSKALDPQSLCILSDRYIWKLLIEIVVIIDDGNTIDCILNGTILALMDFRKPLIRIQHAELIADNTVKQPLSLAHFPFSMTFGLFENNIYYDLSLYQQRVSKSRLTISMNVYKQLCSIHKPGGLGMSKQSLSSCIKIVEKEIKKINDKMKIIVKQKICQEKI